MAIKKPSAIPGVTIIQSKPYFQLKQKQIATDVTTVEKLDIKIGIYVVSNEHESLQSFPKRMAAPPD